MQRDADISTLLDVDQENRIWLFYRKHWVFEVGCAPKIKTVRLMVVRELELVHKYEWREFIDEVHGALLKVGGNLKSCGRCRVKTEVRMKDRG
jgi:hypothetical protein